MGRVWARAGAGGGRGGGGGCPPRDTGAAAAGRALAAPARALPATHGAAAANGRSGKLRRGAGEMHEGGQAEGDGRGKRASVARPRSLGTRPRRGRARAGPWVFFQPGRPCAGPFGPPPPAARAHVRPANGPHANSAGRPPLGASLSRPAAWASRTLQSPHHPPCMAPRGANSVPRAPRGKPRRPSQTVACAFGAART